MSRGIGEFDIIQDELPEYLAPIIAFFTQLGDIWFLTLLLAILYWTQTDLQDDIALVAGTFVAGIGLYRSLKFLFGWPRPEEPLLDPELVHWIIRPFYEATAFSHSYGFPSGHATIATIVYVGLATVIPYSTPFRRYLVAGFLVVFVSFTRIALGLHYLVDVVVGTTLGLAILFVTFHGDRYIRGDSATIILGLAILLNSIYLVASDIHVEAVIMLGAALGFFGGWQLVVLARELALAPRPSAAIEPLIVRGGLAVASLAPLVIALEEFPLLTGEPYPIGGVVGLIVAVTIILPIARHSKRFQRAGAGVRFWTLATYSWLRRLVKRLWTGLSTGQREK